MLSDTGDRRYYRDPVQWTDWVTAVGALLGGLALQLGALHQDRLRAQVGKVGAWTKPPEQVSAIEQPAAERDTVEWAIQILIRNSSELPVTADTAELSVRPWGYNLVPVEGTGGNEFLADKQFGDTDWLPFAPGTIAPGETWNVIRGYRQRVVYAQPQPPMVTVSRIVITDAVGYQWEMRPRKAGPPRRVHRWRRWWWRHTGKL